jgi:hypothetical protein
MRGSEGAPAQQCAGATRCLGTAGHARRLGTVADLRTAQGRMAPESKGLRASAREVADLRTAQGRVALAATSSALRHVGRNAPRESRVSRGARPSTLAGRARPRSA